MRTLFNVVIGVVCIFVYTIVYSTPLSGTYERVSLSKREAGHLVVSIISKKEAKVDLTALYNPYPSDGRFVYKYDEGLSRNGVLEGEIIQLSGDVGLFHTPNDDASPCTIVFVFSRTYVDIKQFEEDCGLFGVGVNATGRYILHQKKAISK